MSTSRNETQTSEDSGPVRQMRILIAIDGSEVAHWVFEVGPKMAQRMFAEVLLVNVVVPATGVAGEFSTALQRLDRLHRHQGERLLESLRQMLPPAIASRQIVREGLPADEIIGAGRVSEADVIVMGTHARGRVAQFILGSTAEAVIRRAPCPVVTVGRRAEWAKRAKQTAKPQQKPEAARV
jgi:nucleotide-binding universal stress UspA family protein